MAGKGVAGVRPGRPGVMSGWEGYRVAERNKRDRVARKGKGLSAPAASSSTVVTGRPADLSGVLPGS